MSTGRIVTALLGLAITAGGGWYGWNFYQTALAVKTVFQIPTTTVKKGDVQISVTARGELQGAKSAMLTAPMAGGRDMVITMLSKPGEMVDSGDVVTQFDTTEQDFNLREAEADFAEAEQQLIQAKAESEAKQEEGRYALIHAKAMLELAELEVKRNPLLPAIVARQNLLALEAAQDQLRKLERDLANRTATGLAGIAIQEAARNKAKVKADTARRNIEMMTLKAPKKGYVAVQENRNTNFMYTGMVLPMLQVGDTVRAGMAVVQIPDMESWEISTRLGELDRGHLAVGQAASVSIVALPGKSFKGRVSNIGGTAGPPWDRKFECKITVDDPVEELRPGMSAHAVVSTGLLKDVLWIPSQALFETDGRNFVYLETENGFRTVDVKLVRRSESQAVITGLQEGQRVAMASPDQAQDKAPSGAGGVMKAIPKS